jgi:linearmycin/streptolysin S transport system permease protein
MSAIGPLLRIGYLNVRRDRVVLAMVFLLPVMFFSIFASVFGNQRDSTAKIQVAVADLDQSDYSKKIVAALAAEGGLRVRTTEKEDGTGAVLDRDKAEDLVKKGTLPVAVVLPKGFGAGGRFFERDESAPKVQLLADVSDPIAPQMVQGLLQKVSFTAAPDVLATQGMGMLEKYGGPLTPAQRSSMEQWRKVLAAQGSGPNQVAANVGPAIEIVNVMQPGYGNVGIVSFYAAGIGVMFLLFSASGAGGALLDEEESGTLGRLVGSRAGMTGVLAGKWLFITMLGILQLIVMFTWGMLVFHLPLVPHLPGFFVMTIATSAAAAAFGLVLATISHSRAQLSGISTIVILAMSAVGGSMFPRFLMSEGMQKMGLVTFNAWALDGYIKVFWRNQPVTELWPQVGVLLLLCAVFLYAARMFARRWETL